MRPSNNRLATLFTLQSSPYVSYCIPFYSEACFFTPFCIKVGCSDPFGRVNRPPHARFAPGTVPGKLKKILFDNFRFNEFCGGGTHCQPYIDAVKPSDFFDSGCLLTSAEYPRTYHSCIEAEC